MMGRDRLQNPSKKGASFDWAMGRDGHVMRAILLGC